MRADKIKSLVRPRLNGRTGKQGERHLRYYSNVILEEGFAWITALPSEDIFYDKNGELQIAAALGAQSLLGFTPTSLFDADADAQSTYLRLWAAHSGHTACTWDTLPQ